MLVKLNISALTLLLALAANPAFGHTGEDAPAFVAVDGVDTGRCLDVAAPCQTIAYALSQLGKGGKIRVAAGQFTVTDGDELFHLLNGAIEISGGYDKEREFRGPANEPTVLSGVPLKYAAAMQARGFEVIADNKAVDREAFEKLYRNLEQHQALQLSMPATPCVGGLASGLACQDVDLLSHVGFVDISANPGSAADVWGFVDLNSDREYAIVGFDIGVAVFDVTDAEQPREVGFIDGQQTSWRDIKVYQYWNAAQSRWNAQAYITADGASDGLFVVDLGDLPHSIRRVNYSGDFVRAHNVYATNTDFGTGLSLTGDTPTLIVAGSNINSGPYRSYGVNNPAAPGFIDMPGSGGNDYMHDAASMIIKDSRKDTQCVNGSAYCEVLFDFNETTFDVWDITESDNPTRLSRTTYNNARYVHSGWWSEDKQYLFVHDELDERNVGLNTTVYVYDLGDLGAPTAVTAWVGPTAAIDHNGFVRGNRYYMSNYSRGLTILDISNVTDIQAVGRFDTFPGSDGNSFVGAWGAYPYLHSGNIAVSDINSGFYMLVDRTLEVPQGRLAFSNRSYGGSEGDQLQLPVSRLGGASGSVSVAYEIFGATADASDVLGGSGVLNWSNGDGADKFITLDLLNDADAGEGLERLFIKLVAPSGGATLDPKNIASVYVGEIAAAAGVAFATTDVRTAERGFATAVAVIHRSGSAIGAVSVDYSMTGGDAVANVDFQGVVNGTVSWADGDATPKSVEFAITDDGAAESEEFFELTLSNASGAIIAAAGTLRVAIADGAGVNNAPNAVAGANQVVTAGDIVTLDGGASNDPDGDALGYLWTQVAGTTATLSDAMSATTTFTAPGVGSDEVLQFELTVSDGVFTDTSATVVTVLRDGKKKGGGSVNYLLLLMLLAAAAFTRPPTVRS